VITHMDVYYRDAEMERMRRCAALLSEVADKRPPAMPWRARLLTTLARWAGPRHVPDDAILEWRARPVRAELRMLLRADGVSGG
jgi:hypothetical protein